MTAASSFLSRKPVRGATPKLDIKTRTPAAPVRKLPAETAPAVVVKSRKANRYTRTWRLDTYIKAAIGTELEAHVARRRRQDPTLKMNHVIEQALVAYLDANR